MFHSSKCRVQFSQVYLKYAWGGIKKTNIKIYRVVRNMQSNLYIIKIDLHKLSRYRGVFRILLNIYDGEFCKNS